MSGKARRWAGSMFQPSCRPDAEQAPAFAHGAEHRFAGEDLGRARPARPAALHRIGHHHVVAGAQEEHLPAGAAIGRRLVGHAGQPAAMGQDDRVARARVLQAHHLRVHLLDLELAVGVDAQRRRAGAEHDLALRQAGQLRDAPADMEGGDVADAQRRPVAARCAPFRRAPGSRPGLGHGLGRTEQRAQRQQRDPHHRHPLLRAIGPCAVANLSRPPRCASLVRMDTPPQAPAARRADPRRALAHAAGPAARGKALHPERGGARPGDRHRRWPDRALRAGRRPVGRDRRQSADRHRGPRRDRRRLHRHGPGRLPRRAQRGRPLRRRARGARRRRRSTTRTASAGRSPPSCTATACAAMRCAWRSTASAPTAAAGSTS